MNAEQQVDTNINLHQEDIPFEESDRNKRIEQENHIGSGSNEIVDKREENNKIQPSMADSSLNGVSFVMPTDQEDLNALPIVEGMLQKKKNEKAFKLFSSTNKRWFVLDSNKRIFYYSKNQKSSKPKKVINVDDIIQVHEKSDTKKANACDFMIETKDRKYVFIADNQNEHMKWVSGFVAAITAPIKQKKVVEYQQKPVQVVEQKKENNGNNPFEIAENKPHMDLSESPVKMGERKSKIDNARMSTCSLDGQEIDENVEENAYVSHPASHKLGTALKKLTFRRTEFENQNREPFGEVSNEIKHSSLKIEEEPEEPVKSVRFQDELDVREEDKIDENFDGVLVENVSQIQQEVLGIEF